MSEERRLVTVLFADVTGSTALGETLDPEDLRALLTRYFAIAREVIGDHDGTLEKFIGDAVMAVFGLPVAHGDDASRAVAAAIELSDRVRADALLGDRLPIRVGVNTGEVVAARDAAQGGEFLITGDAVNVAARLVQGAEPWTVVCGERTVRAAEVDFEFDGLAVVEARGKSNPVRAARLTGRREKRRQTVPLLGRNADLAQLDLLASRAFGEARPYLVSVIAPAGTGKTRLLEEFLGHVGRDYGDALVATAQLLPYGQRLTYWPLRPILFTLAGATEDTRTDDLRAGLIERLRDLEVDEPEAVAGQLLASIGAADEEVVDKSDLLTAWRTVFEHAARERPLVIVFEDLHWSSESFLDLVEFVTQPRGQARLLMLVLTRPELLERRPAWGGGRRNHVAIALEPLDDRSIRELVGHLLESPSNEVVEAVARRAEGNPFYAGELVRSLIDRLGADPVHGDVDAALASLPDTVQATVLARLDALPAPERRCLQLGAVFGRSFRPAGLVALDEAVAVAAADSLDALLDRDMVRAAGSDEYVFRHILIREVAYGTLPRAERGRLHARAGSWLEQRAQGSEEAYAELIAYHYREAATLATLLGEDEQQALKLKAVEWLRRAADAALAARADLEARAHLLKALEWAESGVLADIHERIGDAYLGGDATIAAFGTAYQLARAAGRPPNDLLRVLGKRLEFETRFVGAVANPTPEAEMEALIAHGHELLADVTDSVARARFYAGLAFLGAWWLVVDQKHRIDERADEENARLALELAEATDDAALMSAALDAMGAIAMGRGQWRQMLPDIERRLELVDRLPVTERVDAQSMAAWVSASLGDLARVEEICRLALARLQPGQAPAWSLHLLTWRAVALFWLGRWDEALADANRGRRVWEDLDRASTGYATGCFAAALEIARARRDADGAAGWRDVIKAILGTGRKTTELTILNLALADGDLRGVADQLVTMPRTSFPAWIAMAMSACADQLVQQPDASLTRWLQTSVIEETALVEGEIRRALGLQNADAEELRSALAIFERCGARPAAARVRCELGLLTGDPSLYETGAAYLESVGDADQLERYESRRRAN